MVRFLQLKSYNKVKYNASRRKVLCKEVSEKEVQFGHTELILEKLTGKEDKLKKAIKKLKCAFAGYCHGEIMGHPE